MDIQLKEVKQIIFKIELKIKQKNKADLKRKISGDIISDSDVLTVPLLNKLWFYLRKPPEEQQYWDVLA